jgi:hypothetical protein
MTVKFKRAWTEADVRGLISQPESIRREYKVGVMFDRDPESKWVEGLANVDTIAGHAARRDAPWHLILESKGYAPLEEAKTAPAERCGGGECGWRASAVGLRGGAKCIRNGEFSMARSRAQARSARIH